MQNVTNLIILSEEKAAEKKKSSVHDRLGQRVDGLQSRKMEKTKRTVTEESPNREKKKIKLKRRVVEDGKNGLLTLVGRCKRLNLVMAVISIVSVWNGTVE